MGALAAAGGLAALFPANLVYKNGGNDHDQNSGNGDGPEILLDPLQHNDHSFLRNVL